MREVEIRMCVRLAAVVAVCLLFLLLIRLCAPVAKGKILMAYEEFTGLLKEKGHNTSWYQRTERLLHCQGAQFHYGTWINAERYLLLRFFLAMAGGVIGGKLAIGYGILIGIVLFYLPAWLLQYMNQQDNIKLLPEIKLVYHALEIQIRAGVYVTDALAECYGSVREVRLQKALLDLAGDIVMKADIFEALQHFQSRFDNRYIDSLCITLVQACESGQAVELLSDIGEQLKDMEAVIRNRRKSSLDRNITFYQLGMLVAVLGVVLYACVSHMFAAAGRI